MGAPDILGRLKADGVNLRIRGGNLIATPKEAVTPEIVTLIRAHKPELLQALSESGHADMPAKASERSSGQRGATALYPQPAGISLSDALKIAGVEDDPAESRRQKVLAMLAEQPGARWACVTNTEDDPENVIVAVAMRDVATFELLIPRDKWDGVLFVEALERHTIQ